MNFKCVKYFTAVASVAAVVGRGSAFVCVPPTATAAREAGCSWRGALLGASTPGGGYCRASQDYSRSTRRKTRVAAEIDGSTAPGEGSTPSLSSLPGMKTIVETEEEEELRMLREWEDDGRKGRVLVRRKELPNPEMQPANVCQLVFQSLQNNDDPMLDYGAAVAIKFASSKNAIKNMSPPEYGAFLRNDPEHVLLIDNAACRPAERAKVSPDGKTVLQKVELVGVYPDTTKKVVDVQLGKEDDCWKIDAISFASV